MRRGDFDPATHTYRIGGRLVPSVTQVLGDLIPGWRASDWYLQRGRAVHACAALLARGVPFESDPQIAGQVEALRKFFAEVNPRVIWAEKQVYSELYQYAGTLDLFCDIGAKTNVVLDYKSALTGTVPIQCAAYALALPGDPRWGLGVEIRDDGTYRMSEVYDLRRYKAEWLALLTTYNIRRRLGCQKVGEE